MGNPYFLLPFVFSGESDLTEEKVLALVAHEVCNTDNAGPIPTASDFSTEDQDDLALSRSEEFNAILRRSQERLEREGPVSAEEVRRRPGL